MDFKSLRVDKLKYSMEQMAELCKVSPAEIEEWEDTGEPPSSALKAIKDGTDLSLDEIMNYKKPEIKKSKDKIIQRDEYEKILRGIHENELSRKKENNKKIEEIRNYINTCNQETLKEFSTYCSNMMDIGFLIQRIKDENIKYKKESIESFVNKLEAMMKIKIDEILNAKSGGLSKKIDEYIRQNSNSITQSFDKIKQNTDVDIDHIISDYIVHNTITAKKVLSTLGTTIVYLSFGGLLWGLGIVLMKIIKANWEKEIATTIVKKIEKERITEKYQNNIKQYWENERGKFNNIVVELDKQWDEYVARLHKAVESYDIAATD